MKDKIRSFRDLKIWKLGIEILENIYKITKTYPKYERYGLTAQMQRCAVSIPSNIAEGFARKHNKEYKQFLYIALGSCAELETQIEISLKLKYLDTAGYKELAEKMNHITRMIINLQKLL